MLSFKQFFKEDDDRYLRIAVINNGKLFQGHQGEPHEDLIHRYRLDPPHKRVYTNHLGQVMKAEHAFNYAKENDLFHNKLRRKLNNPLFRDNTPLITDYIKSRKFK
jgi:hypothetical protein